MKLKKTVAIALILFTLFVINVIAIGLLSANDSVAKIDKAKNLTIVAITDNKSSTTNTNTQTSSNTAQQTQATSNTQSYTTPVRITSAS